MSFTKQALTLALSLLISSTTLFASPFDDAYDDFEQDEAETERAPGTQVDLSDARQRARSTRAPKCATPLQRDTSAQARLNQKANDQMGKLNEQLTLYFIDAVTGQGVSGATVSFEGARGETDRGGRVCFHYPKGDLMREALPAQFERQGYVSAEVKLSFMAGALFFNRFSVTKALPPGKLRVVLDWEGEPKDLDAHLVREGSYHISYQDMRAYQDLAALDRDDRDGFGPETITLHRLEQRATYRFFVRDFTRSGRFAESKARVHVYTEQGLLKSFEVPTSLKGHEWPVFTIEGGQLR